VVLKDVPRTGLVPVPATLPREGSAVRRTVQTARSATGLLAPPSTALGAGVLRPGQAATLPGRFLFDFDSARLTPRGHQVVKDLVRHVAGNRAVTCEGYTDYAGDPGHELDLSARRSVAVCRALQAYGAKVRTATKGYGGSKPVVLGGRATERHDNRRVVVVVTG
jgi:outer membrane protein OmpA-like peptidoglycan-associated protein